MNKNPSLSFEKTITDRMTKLNSLDLLPIEKKMCGRARSLSLKRFEPYDLQRSVIERIENIAVVNPDIISIRDDDRKLTYKQLIDETRKLASFLTKQLNPEGQIIAVGGPRNAECIIAFLAIELIGAVYLPIDEHWPENRIRTVIKQSNAKHFLISRSQNILSSPLDNKKNAIDCSFSYIHESLDSKRYHGLPDDFHSDKPRYVLYTSGSTGKPKGAIVAHRGMMNHLLSKVQDLDLTDRDCIVLNAPITFDISIWQMLAALLVGGKVVVMMDDAVHDCNELMNTIQSRNITVLEVVPSIIRVLLYENEKRDRGSDLKSLRWLISTGEALSPETARQWMISFPKIPILNAYGPTECSDDVTHHIVEFPNSEIPHLPIGTPVANTSLYVLKRESGNWLPCSDNEKGELFVGGAGIGLGYLANDNNTRSSFYLDPFEKTRSGLIYRTGDTVLRSSKGELIYLGRVDRQVKVAGVRIELDEIESALKRNPQVDNSAVTLYSSEACDALVARETTLKNVSKRSHLIAYVSGKTIEASKLRAFLTEILPISMIPEKILEVSHIPLTRNGKIDYEQLPKHGKVASITSKNSEPPQGPYEEAIAKAICNVFGLDKIGRKDSFLDLGGDSLQAMCVIADLRSSGYFLTIRDVILKNTIEKIAKCVSEKTQQDATVKTQIKLQNQIYHKKTSNRLLTPQQAGIYFQWRLAPNNPYYSYQGSLQLQGTLDLSAFDNAWNILLEENPSLLSRFYEKEGKLMHEYPFYSVQIPLATDIFMMSQEEKEKLYRDNAYTISALPFDLIEKPILRLHFYKFSPNEYRLLMTMHEILIDGWGMNALLVRFAKIYQECLKGNVKADKRLSQNYNQYLDWQELYLKKSKLKGSELYWKKQLSGELPILKLPNDNLDKRKNSYQSKNIEHILDDKLVEEIHNMCTRINCTPFIILLSAYGLSLSYYSGDDDIIIGAPIANRNAPEQIKVTSFLLNMLPFCFRIEPELKALDFLMRIRDTVFSGYSNSEYPFSWMVKNDDSLRGAFFDTPAFQTMINTLNYPNKSINVDDMKFTFTELDTGYTKYQCSLYMQPHGENELLLQLAYNIDRINERAAQNLMSSTIKALVALVNEPNKGLMDIDLLPYET